MDVTKGAISMAAVIVLIMVWAVLAMIWEGVAEMVRWILKLFD